MEQNQKKIPLPILRTKLYKPLVKDHYVIREDIIDSLEENRQNPLTLVVAAAGFGKSVTVSQWLNKTKVRSCWLSLDDEFNDVLTFFFYLVHAIRTVFPESLTELHTLVHGTETPPLKILIRYLINDLNELPEEFIIVLDDYHRINNSTIYKTIDTILNNPPGDVHMVVISRRDPPINITKIRSYDNLFDLRMSRLRFSTDEIVTLAKKYLSIEITRDQASILEQKTEGWIVGLRMTLMRIAKSENVEDTIEELKIDQQNLHQYLAEEVLLRQPESMRKLLLVASISDRFSREFLEAVLESEDENALYPDNALFDQLISSTLFIIPLDEEGHWYRFHHSFYDFLSKHFEIEFTKEQILAYHKKASLFFEENQLFDQAIRYAVKSDDVNRIVQIFERHKHKLLDRDEFTRLKNWIELVPDAFIDTQPQILLTRAFLYDTTADYQAMKNDLALAESILPGLPADTETSGHMWGEYYAIRSCLSYITGNTEEALNNSKEALNLLPHRSTYLRAFVLAYRSLALQNSGQVKKVSKMLETSINEMSSASTSRLRILLIKSMVYAFEGNLPVILDSALQYRQISLVKKLYVSFTYAIYYVGAVYYLRNELDKVAEVIDEIQDYYYAGRPFWILNCLFIRGFTLLAQGKTSELEILLQKLDTFVDDYDNQKFQKFVNAFKIELTLRQNNMVEVWQLSKDADFEIYPPIFYFYFPQLTHIRLLMSSGKPEKIADARTRLNQLIEFGRSTYRKNLLIQALPLQALLYQKTGNEKNAVKTLNEALTLAKPTGHIRSFLDLGAPMQEMIEALYRKRPDDTYLAKIEKAFKEEQVNLSKMSGQRSATLPIFPVTEIEKITKREIHLLQLVEEGYQNKEIAEKLHVAPDSIKKSLYRLYQKLNVHNRTSAISKAVKMDLI